MKHSRGYSLYKYLSIDVRIMCSYLLVFEFIVTNLQNYRCLRLMSNTKTLENVFKGIQRLCDRVRLTEVIELYQTYDNSLI